MAAVEKHSFLMTDIYVGVCVRNEVDTFQLHEVWGVVMDHSKQCSSITNIPHQVFQQWEEGQLST